MAEAAERRQYLQVVLGTGAGAGGMPIRESMGRLSRNMQNTGHSFSIAAQQITTNFVVCHLMVSVYLGAPTVAQLAPLLSISHRL